MGFLLLLLAVINNAMSIHVHAFFYGHAFSIPLDTELSMELLDHMVTLFQSSCTTLYSHQQYIKDPIYKGALSMVVICPYFLLQPSK